jgi:hypothetical protein
VLLPSQELERKSPRIWPAALLIVLSNLMAIILIRHPGMTWPAYFFGALSFVNLFAIALGGTVVIRRAAIATVLAAVFWWASPVAKVFLPFSGAPGWSLGPVVIWVLLVAHSASVLRTRGPRSADESRVSRARQAMFLMMAAFVFGMWGVLGIHSKYEAGSRWLPGLAVIMVVLMPLFLTSLDAISRALDAGRRRRAAVGAAFTAASAYVTALQLLIVVAGPVSHDLPWPFSAVSALGMAHLPWGLISDWKAVISCVVGTIVFVAIAVSIIVKVLEESASGRLGRGTKAEREIRARIERLAQIRNPAQQVSEHAHILSLQFSNAIEITFRLGTQLLAEIAACVRAAFLSALASVTRAVCVLVVTGVLFSGASRLMIAACDDLARYAGGSGARYHGLSLWGGLVLLVGMLLVLGCGAFALLSRVARHGEVDVGPLLTGKVITWVCITAGAAAALGTLWTGLMWALDILLPRAGLHVHPMELGPLLRLNLCHVAAVTVALLIAAWQSSDDSQEDQDFSSSFNGWHAGILITTVLAGAVLGWDPIIHWIASVL